MNIPGFFAEGAFREQQLYQRISSFENGTGWHSSLRGCPLP